MVTSKRPSEKRRVVIIDDDLSFAQFLTKMVGTFGHDVIVKADPTASHTYEIRDSDIVFLGLVMPRVNGLQVLQQLSRQNSKCEICIMSGNSELLAQGEKLLQQLDLRLTGVLEKPFRAADIADILQGHMHR